MWIRLEDAQKALADFKSKVPPPKASKLEWSKYDQLFHWFLHDLIATVGKLPDDLVKSYSKIFGSDFQPSGGIPVANDWIMRGYAKSEGIKQWADVLLLWLEQGYKRGQFPKQRQGQQLQQPAVKGWWFFGNGVKAILQINGVNIPLESSTKGKGKAYPLILLQFLSWPDVVTISEQEFGQAVRNRWGIEDADTDSYKPKAFTDMIRALNTSVKERLKTTDDFIVKNGFSYSVNQKFK